MGKIFKALEKSQKTLNEPQQHVNAVQEDIDTFENKSVPQVPDMDNHESHDIQNQAISMKIDPMLVSGLKPQSVEAEQFRLLKNAILFPEKGNPPRCIMIASASSGEGKSFVAANLAISLSQNIDEHVLLLDCDLRSPSIHTFFGLESTKGLSEYLSNSEPLSSLLVKTPLNKLTILPAGKIPFNPSELLSSEQMRQLINELKQRYNDRYIIIDTPPPYLTSEAGVISRHVDGIVIVVRQGETRKRSISDLIDIYGKEKILGVVYNFAKKGIGYGYGKYGYGKYGYGLK